MSSIQPPSPPSGTSLGSSRLSGVTDLGSSTVWDQPKKASSLPALFGALFLLLSFALWWFRFELGQEWFAVLGYFLTPYAVFACLMWDVLWQRQAQKNPWFDVRPAYTAFLRAVSVVSLGVAVLHILEISRRVGQLAVEQGWG